jgi:hypothetical protein
VAGIALGVDRCNVGIVGMDVGRSMKRIIETTKWRIVDLVGVDVCWSMRRIIETTKWWLIIVCAISLVVADAWMLVHLMNLYGPWAFLGVILAEIGIIVWGGIYFALGDGN